MDCFYQRCRKGLINQSTLPESLDQILVGSGRMVPLKMQARFSALPSCPGTCAFGITKSIFGAPVSFKQDIMGHFLTSKQILFHILSLVVRDCAVARPGQIQSYKQRVGSHKK